MPCTRLNVPRVQQIDDDSCGPACAQMILLALHLVRDGSDDVQRALGKEIQQSTKSAKVETTERCAKPPALEWATHPVGLQRTLNAHIKPKATEVIPSAEEDTAAGHALRSVKRGIAAAALVSDATHWIVVFGCEHSTRRELPTLELNGDPVTHILVRDPALSGFPVRMTLDEWTAGLYRVKCGKFNQKCIVVGAR